MKKVEITDVDVLNKYISEYVIETSEISVTNLLMWRNKYHFYYKIVYDFLWLINVKDENTYYYSQPIGNYNNKDLLRDSIKQILDLQQKRGQPFILKKCDDRFFDVLKDLGFNFTSMEIRDDFDYLYDYKALKALEGKKYHKKKNHINKFMKTYSHWTYEALTLDNIDALTAINRKWFKKALAENDLALMDEFNAINEAIKYFGQLNYSGGLIKVNDVACAYILAERLNRDTLLIHIEKADTSYQGIYPMIFHQYLINHDGAYTYINREQDLGIEGLRKSKLSYHPVRLVSKRQIEIINFNG